MDNRERLIIRQVAIKCAVELAANDKIETKDILNKAQIITNWIMKDGSN